jgi:DNA-binding NarL/FixJ family response regulator
VEAVSRGLLNKQIASELYVTEATVKFHLGNIYRKLGLVNRTQLVALAWQTADGVLLRIG